MEVKEMSTRQKLEDFKRKLAESREGSRPAHGLVNSTIQDKSAQDKIENIKRSSPTVSSVAVSHSISTTPERKAANTNPATQTRANTGRQSQKESSERRSPTQTFQKRVEQDRPVHKHSIDKILNKYRSADSINTAQDASIRTAQVDKILAKYKSDKNLADVNSEKSQQHSSRTWDGKHSKPVRERAAHNSARNALKAVANKEENEDRTSEHMSASDSASRVRAPLTYTRVKVPRSAMEYDALLLNKAADHQPSHSAKSQPTQNGDLKNERRDFESTLKSMLEARGQKGRRTEAWSSSTARVQGSQQPVSAKIIYIYLSL